MWMDGYSEDFSGGKILMAKYLIIQYKAWGFFVLYLIFWEYNHYL